MVEHFLPTPTKSATPTKFADADEDSDFLPTPTKSAADEVSDKPKRHREINVYEPVKRWVTGEMAELEPCDIRHQLDLEARKLTNESGMVKLPNKKGTKKQACNVEEECIAYKSLQYQT